MKLTTLQENLKSALLQLQKAVPTKPQLPILSSVLLTATETLTLAGTDLYLGVKSQIPAEVTEPGVIAVPGEIFRQLITSLPAGKIELALEGNSLLVKTATTQSKIPYQSSEEYPQFPEIKGEIQNFSTEELAMVVNQVNFAISTDQSRPVLTAMLFNFMAEGLEIVGTDGFRLAIIRLAGHQLSENQKILLPAKAIQEVSRIATQLKAATISCQFDPELKQAKFLIDQTEVFVRMIEGEFPPYTKIVPTEFVQQITFDREALLAELKRALFFARETSNIVRLTLSADEISIMARSPSYGEYQGKTPLQGKVTEEITIAFNVVYLIEFLSAQSTAEVWLGINESLKPVSFRIAEQAGQQYVVMPFRVSEG